MPFHRRDQERSLRSAPERLEVSIRDDGVGMASFREGSLGYGLVRSLVEQINGNIAVQSDPGLTVTISFPAPPTLLEAENEAHPRLRPFVDAASERSAPTR